MPAERQLKALLRALDIDCLWFVHVYLKNQSFFNVNKLRRMLHATFLGSRIGRDYI